MVLNILTGGSCPLTPAGYFSMQPGDSQGAAAPCTPTLGVIRNYVFLIFLEFLLSGNFHFKLLFWEFSFSGNLLFCQYSISMSFQFLYSILGIFNSGNFHSASFHSTFTLYLVPICEQTYFKTDKKYDLWCFAWGLVFLGPLANSKASLTKYVLLLIFPDFLKT